MIGYATGCKTRASRHFAMAFITLLIGKFAIRLTARRRAGRHFAEVDSMLHHANLARRLPAVNRLAARS